MRKSQQGVTVTDEDRKYFKEIINSGVKVEIQMVPNDKSEDMKNYID